MTNETIINRFLNHERRDGKSVLTLSAYATDLKQFSVAISPKSLITLPSSLFTVYCLPFTRQLSPNSCVRKLTTIRTFLFWLYQQGYLKQDLSQKIHLPKRVNQTSTSHLSKTKIGRLRRHATILERLLLELLLQTGMKLKDAVRLKRRDVDMNNRKLSLPSSTARFSLPMTDHLYQALFYYLESKAKVSDTLVLSLRGKKISVRTATQILADLSRKARVRHATPRNLRATFIARQIESATPIEIIQQSTGYATIVPLQKYLAQTRPVSHNRKIVLANI